MTSSVLGKEAWCWLAAGCAALLLTAFSIAYLDRPSAYWARDLAPAFVAFCNRLTQLGNSAWYLVPLALAVPLIHFAHGRSADHARKLQLSWLFWAAIFLFLAIAASGLLTDLLKVLCGRARPALLLRMGDFGWHPPGLTAKLQSFPSGHANTVTAAALALGMLVPRLRTALTALAALVLLSRIVVGEHYPSDLAAGAATAFATTFPLRAAFARRGLVFRRTEDGGFAPQRLAD
jgi:membrane-associated phospholipid phosphatase